MNRLYTGLMAIVIGAGGCDRTYTEVPAPIPSQNYCTDEHAKIASLEQKLSEQTTKAQAELAKAKADGQVSCDARVKDIEARYATKTNVELPQEVTPQFPKSDLSMHEIVRGLAAGKYNDAATPTTQNEYDSAQEFPFLYRGFSGDGWYDVTLKEQCLQEKGKKVTDLPAEHTACELGAGVAYNFERGEFEVSSWREFSAKDKENGEYYPVKEVMTFRGVGQALDWSEVTEVDIRTPRTEYGLLTIPVSEIEHDLISVYQKRLAEIPQRVLKHAEAQLKVIHTPVM